MRDVVRLPKAHLHVHLESAFRWSTLREIGAAAGITVPGPPPDGRFESFREFADLGAMVRDCLRRQQDFARIAREFCEDEAAQGVRYAEVTFTAAAHGERLGRRELPLEAVLQGLDEGRAYGIECRLILDHSRRRSVDRAWRTLDLARRYATEGVAAMGLAGEESYPLVPFAEVLDAARDAGLHLVHHAGESHGPDSIRAALTTGHAERLGHGIRVLDDRDLVAEVRDHAIPLEVCPSSNIALGFAASLDEHPLPRLRDAGLAVTLNTDIPAIVGTSLAAEYAQVRRSYGYGDAVLAEFARSAVDASFAAARTKARLRQEIDAWLGSPAGGSGDAASAG